jgi:hypothetical protein
VSRGATTTPTEPLGNTTVLALGKSRDHFDAGRFSISSAWLQRAGVLKSVRVSENGHPIAA